MGHKIEHMLRSVGSLYRSWDEPTAKSIQQQGKIVKKMHFEVKLYLSRIGGSGLEEDLSRRSMELANISTSLKVASEAIAGNMVQLAKRLNVESVSFSTQGAEEIDDFLDRVLSNVQLGLNVMMNQNPGEARELVAAKEKVRSIEQKLQRNLLGRLRKGSVDTIETSNIHQETLRALKQVNTSFSMIGYPILAKSGDLLDSRLSED